MADAHSAEPDIGTMLQPMFLQQRQQLQGQLEAQAALTPGRLQSGGFGENEAYALATLGGQQSATLANAEQQQSLAQMQQNTALIGLGTTAGMTKYTTDINAALTTYGINTNAKLQEWLDTTDNVFKKYGIDTNVLLEEYKSQLALQGQTYSADQSVNAAALYAAASRAAAEASASASMANARLSYTLGVAGLNVTRENNIGNFILGLLGLAPTDINSLNNILGSLFPGTVIGTHP